MSYSTYTSTPPRTPRRAHFRNRSDPFFANSPAGEQHQHGGDMSFDSPGSFRHSIPTADSFYSPASIRTVGYAGDASFHGTPRTGDEYGDESGFATPLPSQLFFSPPASPAQISRHAHTPTRNRASDRRFPSSHSYPDNVFAASPSCNSTSALLQNQEPRAEIARYESPSAARLDSAFQLDDEKPYRRGHIRIASGVPSTFDTEKSEFLTSADDLTTVQEPTPWWKKRAARIGGLLLLLLIIVGAVAGGILGSRRDATSNADSTSVSPSGVDSTSATSSGASASKPAPASATSVPAGLSAPTGFTALWNATGYRSSWGSSTPFLSQSVLSGSTTVDQAAANACAQSCQSSAQCNAVQLVQLSAPAGRSSNIQSVVCALYAAPLAPETATFSTGSNAMSVKSSFTFLAQSLRYEDQTPANQGSVPASPQGARYLQLTPCPAATNSKVPFFANSLWAANPSDVKTDVEVAVVVQQ